MLFNISWRNIWRSRTRSLVVIGAIVVGCWAVIFMSSFSSGLIKSYINNAILHEYSHIQMNNPGFLKDKEIKYFIENPEDILAKVEAKDFVSSATFRSTTNAMVASSKAARGIQVKGILPEKEAAVTKINELVKEGKFLGDQKKNPILISQRIAEKLQVKIRSKVVVTFQNYQGDITSGAFRVCGIFDSGNNPFDEANCFIRMTDLNRLLGDPTIVNTSPTLVSAKEHKTLAHEFAIFLKEGDRVDELTNNLQAEFPALKVRSYKETSPDVELMESQITVSTIIFMIIIMLALVFGIINTMLMAVLERYKELGVLMAIGMNKSKVFFMIVIETIMLALVSVPIGLLVGYGSVKFFENRGIDLSAFSAGMREFGMAEIVYPNIDGNLYWQLALAVGITAILASIYPAYKAIKLKPLEAIRKL